VLQAVEQWLKRLHRRRLGSAGRLLDRLVEIIEPAALACVDFRKIGVAAFQQKARLRIDDVFQTLDRPHDRLQCWVLGRFLCQRLTGFARHGDDQRILWQAVFRACLGHFGGPQL